MVFQKKIRILKQMHKNLCKNRKKNRLIVKKKTIQIILILLKAMINIPFW
jgi:hypothetical protein